MSDSLFVPHDVLRVVCLMAQELNAFVPDDVLRVALMLPVGDKFPEQPVRVVRVVDDAVEMLRFALADFFLAGHARRALVLRWPVFRGGARVRVDVGVSYQNSNQQHHKLVAFT